MPKMLPYRLKFNASTKEAIFVTVEQGSMEASMQSPSRASSGTPTASSVSRSCFEKARSASEQRPNPWV